MAAFKRLVLFLAGSYLLFCAALYGFQRKFLYIPPPIYLTPAGVGLDGAQEIRGADHTDDMQGSDILGWWMPPQNTQRDDNIRDEASHNESAKPVVMFFHGNGSAVFSNHDIYRALHGQGYGVFAAAYPGYPGRTGHPSQEKLTAAARAGYDFVTAQGVDPSKIVFYGTSLGSGVAAQLSAERRPALIIMEAPFTSVADMAQMQFPFLPAGPLTKDKFDSRKALSGSGIPMIWLHGTQDRVIPLTVGQTLYDTYDGPKTAHIIEGGQHNNLWYLGGDAIILKALSNL